ncbi:hypothetical protein QYF61_000884 [Mycteria americana]|uniref:Uncharacterized protein n=1 Tax=Mycteria americana TaxID=33587 RepID=A0AAN7S530_MYCAM|nr:hypothetical protein QYF61_000884 [Mycteria americana]
MKRDKQWMKWLASSRNRKKVSLPPLSWLWRDCPGRSSNSKRIGPTFHLYGPVSQLLGVRVPLLKRGYKGYTPWGTLWFSLCDHGEDMRKHGYVSCKEKQSPKGVLPGKLLLRFPADNFPDRVEGLILLLILMEELLTCMYKKWVMNTMTRTRGALPPARWRKGTTKFTGLCGFDGLAHQTHRSGSARGQGGENRTKSSWAESCVVSRVTTMTQRNSLASNFINWRIPQTDKLNDLTSLTNEQRRFGNGAIFRATRSQTCIYILEEQRKREARKGKEREEERERKSITTLGSRNDDDRRGNPPVVGTRAVPWRACLL